MHRARIRALAALAVAACGRSSPAPNPLADLLAAPAGRFLHVSSTDPTGGNRDYRVIEPADSLVLLDVDGPGEVRRLWITVASRDPQYLRRLALKMYWDGEATPSVAAPLGDFFGNGFSNRHYTALVMGESSGGFYCYLPMPFRRHAHIVVENGTGRPVDAFYYNIDLLTGVSLPRDVATFHAWWHRDPRTTRRTPHLVLQASARGGGGGEFVGLSLNVESYAKNLSFLEGDEIWTVDGERRGQGTGTEDYFNSGWYFDEGTYAAAFHGLIVKDDTAGRIAAYRWHIPDPVPFRDSIRVELEHGTENEEVADYATMAYWYQAEPHAPLPPLPPPGERLVQRVKIPPTAVLAESLQVRRDGALTTVTVPVPRPDRYALRVYVTGPPPDQLVSPPVVAGTVTASGTATASLRLAAGQTPAAVEAAPLRHWVLEWNVVGPFPNPRQGGGASEISAALDSTYGPERDPFLAASYAGAGGSRLRWKRAAAGADGQVRLKPLFTPNDWVAVYAVAFLYSPTARPATLLLGADDAHQLWVNGALVSKRQGRHVSQADDVAVPVQLRRGWNTVLLKDANLDGGWAFQLRAADPDGVLRWSARPPSPGAP
jgi:hypothetical protein